MNSLLEVITFCVSQLFASGTEQVAIALASASAMAFLGWFLASHYTRLWNLHYRIRPGHHILCAVMSVLTFIFVILFFSAAYTEIAARQIVSEWQVQVNTDKDWSNQTFAKAYHAVKALNIEDFTKYPAPEKGGSTIPGNQQTSRQTVSSVYANEATMHFKTHHTYLDMIFSLNSEIPSSIINKDINDFFARNPGVSSYSISQSIELAGQYIKDDLLAQSPKVRQASRTLIVLAFLFFQLLTLGIIGYAAYADIKAVV